jgi:hypothetical protein
VGGYDHQPADRAVEQTVDDRPFLVCGPPRAGHDQEQPGIARDLLDGVDHEREEHVVDRFDDDRDRLVPPLAQRPGERVRVMSESLDRAPDALGRLGGHVVVAVRDS